MSRRLVAWLLPLAALLGAAAAGAQAPPPETRPAKPLAVADAFAPGGVLQARLSPDGRHVAAIVFNGYNQSVMLVKTADWSNRLIITGRWEDDGGYRVNRHASDIRWITPQILAVQYIYGAFAHDLDGKRIADLGAELIGKARPDDAESPLVLVFDNDERRRMAVVDTRTRKRRTIPWPAEGQAWDWAFDDQGELRLLTLANAAFWDDRTTLTTWYRRVDTGTWTKIGERPITEPGFTAFTASSTKDELIVSARHERDTAAIFAYDPINQRHGELLAGHPREDIVRVQTALDGSFRSVVTLGMKPIRHWFDERWAGLQRAVDTALPDRINELSGDPGGLVLVYSRSDRDPGRWLVLNTADMSLRRILVRRSRIDPEAMRPMSVVSYAAPDGLIVPAYLTLPAGPGPHPMVVVVHGGPAIRDFWEWQPDVQLLATRGYAVFQPQFRGSTGFGRAFEEAGHRQWGRAMQDDITAGVEHLIKTGVADPDRICIHGASYGGYAAVWGLIKTPQLYRCGITFAGVSDIGDIFTDWSTDATKVVRELRRVMIGDAERDRATFDAVSPVKRAQDIRAPLLIAHGENDTRVKIAHAKRLMRAMDRHGRPYEWLELTEEGHGLSLVDSAVKFHQRLLDFVDKHIGPGTAPRAAPDNPRP